MPKPNQQVVQFGTYFLPFSQLFLLRKNVYATVNLQPIVPGHVLVCSRRAVKRLCELTEVETVEFWVTVQEVARVIQDLYRSKCNIAVQDGVDSGQTVAHVHCHIIPMPDGKLDQIDAPANNSRGQEDMAQEAAKLRAYFEQTLL